MISNNLSFYLYIMYFYFYQIYQIIMQVPEHRPKKSLGQSFLINEHYAEIEAAHAAGKTVLEIGAGSGMLTGKLCEVAKKVIAVEIDATLYNELKRRIKADNLKLINGDFFSISAEDLELKHIDIVIANIPYSLSSKTIEFLSENNLQAVLCLQKGVCRAYACKARNTQLFKAKRYVAA